MPACLLCSNATTAEPIRWEIPVDDVVVVIRQHLCKPCDNEALLPLSPAFMKTYAIAFREARAIAGAPAGHA